MKYPQTFENLINGLKKLPGVGSKSAERMAYQILNMDDEDITKLATSLLDSKEKLTRCKKCGCMSEGDECEICKDSTRDTKTLCVVQSTKDVYALEKVKNYNGVYHVLNGVISPSLGVTPNDLNLNKLVDRIINDEIKEVILATNPNIEGETTALYIAKLLENKNVEVTRLAYGLPVGASLDYADEYTLIKSLQGRRKL
jgi:recombination protein RecR